MMINKRNFVAQELVFGGTTHFSKIPNLEKMRYSNIINNQYFKLYSGLKIKTNKIHITH
ncbi:hypothetical protein PGB90_004050 [Kerria lacca]